MKQNLKCIVKNEYPLAESPLWNKWRNSLLYVDIEDKKVYEYNIQNESINCIEFEGMVGTVALVDENTIIVAQESKIIKVNLQTQEKETLMTFDIPATMRFNDGKCDEQGRFWVGTLAIDKRASERFEQGHLYSIETNGEVKIHKSKLTVSNGMAWNTDKKLMYFTDTYTKKVDTYEYDSENGTMKYKETKIIIPEGLGGPDGSTIDEEGMVWVAIWGGGCVLRFNPDSGEILSRIDLPDKNVTCCIFGGENLDTLYITTASDEDGNKGGLYSIQTSTKGKETNLCKGKWLVPLTDSINHK